MGKHGYDDNKSSITQLKRVLNLPGNKFEEIKLAVKSLTLTILDIELQGQFQAKNMSAVEEKLKALYPEIFDTAQKVAFGRQLSLQFHRQARRVRHPNCFCPRQAPTSPRRDSVDVAKLLCDSARPPPTRRSNRGNRSEISAPRKQELETGPHALCHSVAGHPIHVGSATRHLEGQESSSAAPPLCQKMQMVACEPATATSTSTATASSSRPSEPTRNGVWHMHDFLQKCSPPLGHLLSRFVDLGFQSPVMLREVASQWTADERRDLLKRIAPGPNGEGLTELEMVTLERGFRSASII